MVTGSFDMPLGVFAFYDAGSARGRRRGRSRGDELADGVTPEPPDGVARLRGERLVADPAAVTVPDAG